MMREDELTQLINNGSYDPDGGTGLTLTASPPGEGLLDGDVITLTVTDDWGESSSCQSTIRVVDEEPPAVDCGSIGIIAPCQVSSQAPLPLEFAPQTKANGCTAETLVQHLGCFVCDENRGKVEIHKCKVSELGIEASGDVQSHLEFNVTVTNTIASALGSEPLSVWETCTICTQDPSVDFDPGCPSNQKKVNKGKVTSLDHYVCEDGFPSARFTCASSV
jgi:hypothetical protein